MLLRTTTVSQLCLCVLDLIENMIYITLNMISIFFFQAEDGIRGDVADDGHEDGDDRMHADRHADDRTEVGLDEGDGGDEQNARPLQPDGDGSGEFLQAVDHEGSLLPFVSSCSTGTPHSQRLRKL